MKIRPLQDQFWLNGLQRNQRPKGELLFLIAQKKNPLKALLWQSVTANGVTTASWLR